MSNKIKNIAIIGAGTMGQRIALKAISCNYNVRLYDINYEALMKFTNSQKNQEIKACNSITEAVLDSDLIIEAVPEKLELKLKIFKEVDKNAPPHAIITTNSSSIPVSKLEGVVKRKDKVLNIHFYIGTSEYGLTEMADIMRGTMTSVEVFEIGKSWIESIGFRPLIVLKESFGFVFNRIWRAIKKECLKVWAGGYADIEDIDAAWKIALGKAEGPFMIMDRIGLDVVYDIEMSYFKNSGKADDKPPQALKEMVDKGFLGLKTKIGFYEH